ncbi:MAG: hypothetical protein Q8R40_00145 [bacterium]|nr:hypothetical protein [bacterium]
MYKIHGKGLTYRPYHTYIFPDNNEDTIVLSPWYLLPSQRLGRAQLRWENFIHGLTPVDEVLK